MHRRRWAWACSAADSRQPARGASVRRASGRAALSLGGPWTPCPCGGRRDEAECSSPIGARVGLGHRLGRHAFSRVVHVLIPVRFRFPSQRWPLACLATACLLLLAAGCRQQQAPAPVQPPPKTVVASGSEDAGAVSSDAKPVVPTQAEVLQGTDWPALRLVSGDAWIDCDVPGAPLPGSVVVLPGPASPAAHADIASPGKDVAAVALGVSDAAAAPLPPPEPTTDEASGDAPEEEVALEEATSEGEGHDAMNAGIADGPVDAPRPLVDLGFEDVQAAMAPCRERGTMRLRYEGKISGDFTALVQRVAAMADRMDINARTLDIDSTG